MKFILTFTWSANGKVRNERISRFLKTGGLPGKDVILLGRWINVDLSGGFALVETDKFRALSEFILMWNDLLIVKAIPVMEDNELTAALKTVELPLV